MDLVLNLAPPIPQNTVRDPAPPPPRPNKEEFARKRRREEPIAAEKPATEVKKRPRYIPKVTRIPKVAKLLSAETIPKQQEKLKKPQEQEPEKELEEQVEEDLFEQGDFLQLGLESDLADHLEKSSEITRPTKVQARVIPLLLKSNGNLVIQSETGSGKTLAYLLPLVQRLYAELDQVDRSVGTLMLIMSPTRELAAQVSDTVKTLLQVKQKGKRHWMVGGLLSGGDKRSAEKARLRKGVNVLVATPGRLLDHLENTSSFTLDKLRFLVLDEADRFMELGYESKLRKIFEALAKKGNPARQTILCSATFEPKLERLAGAAMEDYERVSFSIKAPTRLIQQVLIVPAKARLVALLRVLGTLIGTGGQKVLVFFSCCEVVEYFYWLFSVMGAELKGKLFKLHGSMDAEDRRETLSQFLRSAEGGGAALFCTDVLARGMDFKQVGHILQYDPPVDVKEYVHRVGRTARIGQTGHATIFLLPEEEEYITLLKQTGMELVQSTFEEADEEKLHLKLEQIIKKDVKRARQAYKSHLKAYSTHVKSEKHIFHPRKLHLGHIAKSFGLTEAPSAFTSLHRTAAANLKAQQKKSAATSATAKATKAAPRKPKKQAPVQQGYGGLSTYTLE